MSGTDNTKVIGLAWPDDRQGSICSLTPLVLSTSATNSMADLHSQRALIASEVEVHLGNSPSASATASGATDTSSGKAVGHYKKNPNTKQVTWTITSTQQQRPIWHQTRLIRMPFNALEVHHQNTMADFPWLGLGLTLHCTKVVSCAIHSLDLKCQIILTISCREPAVRGKDTSAVKSYWKRF